MIDYGKKLAELAIQCGYLKQDKIEGCSQNEIREIMAGQNVDFLPPNYYSFLQQLGKSQGEIWGPQLYYIYTYPELINIKKDVDTFCILFNNKLIPRDAFVFLYGDTGEFAYFRTENKLPHPLVYEASDDHILTTNLNLTEYMCRFIKNCFSESVYHQFLHQFI